MAEYIDKDALLKHKRYISLDRYEIECIVDVDRIIEAQAADVAPVVHCSECKHYKKHSHSAGMRCDHPNLNYDIECFDQWLDVEPDDFCSYGEREDGK